MTARHVNEDTEATDVTISDDDGHLGVIHTTPNHLFWDSTDNRWIPAGQLVPGHQLRGAHFDGLITGVRNLVRPATMHNLTVQINHTYYVLAGATPVLVHNGCDRSAAQQAIADLPDKITSGRILDENGKDLTPGVSSGSDATTKSINDFLTWSQIFITHHLDRIRQPRTSRQSLRGGCGIRASRMRHPRDTHHPQRTNKDRRLTRVSTGQTPFDLARPKGLEPLTF